MKKTLLFGASGLIGSEYLKLYPDTVSVGRSIPNNGLLNRHIHIDSVDDLSILDNEEIDNVVFFIGNSNHHVLNNSQDPTLAMQYNVIPLYKVLEYMSKRNINKFLCLTTILLFGDRPYDHPVSENLPTVPYGNNYVFSKYMAEEVVKLYSKKVPIINCRISNIYGETPLIRPDLIPTLIHDSLIKDEPSVWSTEPIRDFIYAEDACEAINLLLDTPFKGTINLGTGVSHSIRTVCDIVEKLSGKKVVSLNKQVSGVPKFTTDISLLSHLLKGWKPKYTLEEGLTKTFNAMKEHLEKQKAHATN